MNNSEFNQRTIELIKIRNESLSEDVRKYLISGVQSEELEVELNNLKKLFPNISNYEALEMILDKIERDEQSLQKISK